MIVKSNGKHDKKTQQNINILHKTLSDKTNCSYSK
jgi:hypothetical protein